MNRLQAAGLNWVRNKTKQVKLYMNRPQQLRPGKLPTVAPGDATSFLKDVPNVLAFFNTSRVLYIVVLMLLRKRNANGPSFTRIFVILQFVRSKLQLFVLLHLNLFVFLYLFCTDAKHCPKIKKKVSTFKSWAATILIISYLLDLYRLQKE